MGDFAIGQPAAIFVHDYADGRVSEVTVERDTKLYWIADGRKFRKRDSLEPGSTSNWGHGKYLLPMDDPKVTRALDSARKGVAYGGVARAQEALARNREDPIAIEALKNALAQYAEALK